MGMSASTAALVGSAYTPNASINAPPDAGRPLDGVDDRHVIGVGHALEAVDLADHEILGPQQLPARQDLEAAVHDAESVGEAALSEVFDLDRFRAVHCSPFSVDVGASTKVSFGRNARRRRDVISTDQP